MLIATTLAFLLVPQAAPGAALEKFFTGVTEGSGTVDIMLSGRHAMRDRTNGRIGAPGELLLDQVVNEDGKPERKRNWRLLRSGGSQVTGSISDASGPVKGEVTGNTLKLRYRLKEGPSVEQTITLDPGGRSATNRMSFWRFGIRVATVESTIRKVS